MRRPDPGTQGLSVWWVGKSLQGELLETCTSFEIHSLTTWLELDYTPWVSLRLDIPFSFHE